LAPERDLKQPWWHVHVVFKNAILGFAAIKTESLPRLSVEGAYIPDFPEGRIWVLGGPKPKSIDRKGDIGP
jgi:hypothetical protein